MSRARDTADQINRVNSSAADATAITVDSSENVGIGTSSPAIGGGRTYDVALTIDGGVSGGSEDTGALEIGGSTSVNDRLVGSISYFNRDNSGAGATTRKQVAIIEARSVTSDSNAGDDSGANLTFSTKSESGSVAERMRIDSSGNLLVGKTSANPAAAGVAIEVDGDAYFTAEGANGRVLYANRLTSDGDIMQFAKDGTTYGSIGVEFNDNLMVTGKASGHPGIEFAGVGLLPTTNAGGGSNGVFDLGGNGQSWKDAYLSGGIYLGGVGSANKLEDYEEGSWTPVGVGFTVSNIVSAEYVKIGRQVTLTYYINGSSGTSNAARISGLPFTSLSQGYSVGGINLTAANPVTTNILTRVSSSSTHFDILTANDANVPGTSVDSGHIIGTQTYFTNS